MKNLRPYAILDYLKPKKYCSIQELIRHFGVSHATIYRDIAELAEKDAIQKVRGGIALKEPSSGQAFSSTSFPDRMSRNQKQKEAIALQALQRIEENDILFLDSSTTVYCLARLLENSAFSSLTIITNSVMIIQNFHKYPSQYVRIGLGGSYDMQLNSFLGLATLRELEYLEISKAFISAFGVGDNKVTTNHEYHAGLMMKVLNLSVKKYLLVDRSKLNRSGLFRIAPSRIFDEIISG